MLDDAIPVSGGRECAHPAFAGLTRPGGIQPGAVGVEVARDEDTRRA
jgi:hypothetical protein